MNGAPESLLSAHEPLRIGFLDENGNDEYHGMMLDGAVEATRRHNARLIRIGHFLSNNTKRDAEQVDYLLRYVRQYRLDGLMFLGWGRFAVQEHEKRFFEVVGDIPLLSIGVARDDIPSALFEGDAYVEELLLHLILHHGYKRIAFIEPFNPDHRIDVYRRIMRQKGFADSAFIVERACLEGYSVPARGRRAVEILLDERGLKPEAIMSMYNVETEMIVRELQSHGLRVPEDIAVTSYEDGELGRYGSPAYTTILYPWREVGRVACDLMLTRLERARRNRDGGSSPVHGPVTGLSSVMGLSRNSQGALPMQIRVPGQVLYRESCGCKRESVPIVIPTHAQSKPLLEMSEPEWVSLADRIQGRVLLLERARTPDYRALLKGFRAGLQTGNHQLFLHAVEAQMERFRDTEAFRDSGPVLETLRMGVLPHVDKTPAMLLAAEDMFMQADALLSERELRVWGEREHRLKARNRLAEDIGQAVISQYTLSGLAEILRTGLPTLGISDCLLALMDRRSHGQERLAHCVSVFHMVNGKWIGEAGLTEKPASDLIAGFLSEKGVSDCFVSNLLHVGNDVSGFVLYGAGPTDERIYSAMSSHISTALSGIFLTEHLENSFKRLVAHAHKEGMDHAASGLLHNIRNVLGSLRTTTCRLQDALANTPVEAFEQALRLLDTKPDPMDFLLKDPRAKTLLQLLLHLRGPLEIYNGTLHTLNERLQEKNNGIRALLAEQPGAELAATRLEPCDAISVMEEALALGAALSDGSHIRIERRYGVAFAVMAHPNKLLHALVNLVRNACEAMAEVERMEQRLVVELRQEGPKGVFLISDAGVGFSEEHRRTLFLFGKSTKPTGQGIGLHVSANDITAMGGEISADSEGPETGSTFIIRLPLANGSG